MNYSYIHAARFLATLVFGVLLLITRHAIANEIFTPLELQSLRQVLPGPPLLEQSCNQPRCGCTAPDSATNRPEQRAHDRAEPKRAVTRDRSIGHH